MAYGEMFFLGIMFGGVVLLFIALFIDKIQQFQFKKYFMNLDDAKKKEISIHLDLVFENYKDIVEKTNTVLFKRKANAFSNFINYLYKYWLN